MRIQGNKRRAETKACSESESQVREVPSKNSRSDDRNDDHAVIIMRMMMMQAQQSLCASLDACIIHSHCLSLMNALSL